MFPTRFIDGGAIVYFLYDIVEHIGAVFGKTRFGMPINSIAKSAEIETPRPGIKIR